VRRLLDLRRLDGLVGLADHFGDPGDLLHVDLAGAREEPPQPDVLRAEEQHRLGRLAVAPAPADLLEVGVERVRGSRGRRSARPALSMPMPKAVVADDRVESPSMKPPGRVALALGSRAW
jgi:hypothetical protein